MGVRRAGRRPRRRPDRDRRRGVRSRRCRHAGRWCIPSRTFLPPERRRPDRLSRAKRPAAAPPTSASSTPSSDQGRLVGRRQHQARGADFLINRQRAIDYLNTRDQLYVVDGFAGWDPKHQIKVRVVCHPRLPRAVHVEHADPPHAGRAGDFGEPDYVIFNAGCSRPTSLTDRHDQRRRRPVLRARRVRHPRHQYAGEMKKGVFTIMNYLMPKKGVLSMHCSANEGQGRRRLALLRPVGHRQDHAVGRPRRR
jgi:hypothetical protein